MVNEVKVEVALARVEVMLKTQQVSIEKLEQIIRGNGESLPSRVISVEKFQKNVIRILWVVVTSIVGLIVPALAMIIKKLEIF